VLARGVRRDSRFGFACFAIRRELAWPGVLLSHAHPCRDWRPGRIGASRQGHAAYSRDTGTDDPRRQTISALPKQCDIDYLSSIDQLQPRSLCCAGGVHITSRMRRISIRPVSGRNALHAIAGIPVSTKAGSRKCWSAEISAARRQCGSAWIGTSAHRLSKARSEAYGLLRGGNSRIKLGNCRCRQGAVSLRAGNDTRRFWPTINPGSSSPTTPTAITRGKPPITFWPTSVSIKQWQ